MTHRFHDHHPIRASSAPVPANDCSVNKPMLWRRDQTVKHRVLATYTSSGRGDDYVLIQWSVVNCWVWEDSLSRNVTTAVRDPAMSERRLGACLPLGLGHSGGIATDVEEAVAKKGATLPRPCRPVWMPEGTSEPFASAVPSAPAAAPPLSVS